MRYAFVLHKTAKAAARNFRRPINHTLLGSECNVEHASHNEPPLTRPRLHDKRTIVVKKIPQDVSENDLRRLFTNCHVLKYCPARTVLKKTVTIDPDRTKTLWG